ncbi:MAG: peptidylprolyl isomerase [Treponema sp.]|jgi:hypothetical protein|nr:peptidylprolyl isomerase [Treponema sp.]
MAIKGKKPGGHEAEQSEFIRRFKAHPFIFTGTVITLIIVIIAFIFVPAIVPEAGGFVELNFGSYNKIPINYVPGNYFANVRENLARYRQSSTSENNYAETLEIWRGAFEEAVVRTAILEEIKKAGYAPSKEQVDMETARQFQRDGVFDAELYRQMDRGERMSLWRGVRDYLIHQRYREDLTGLRIPSKETEFIAAMTSPKRSFDMAAFPLSSYPDSEITAYAAEKPELFQFTHLSRITLGSSEAEARTVLNSIQDGTTTFEEAAGIHSKDNYAGQSGDMGLKMIYELTAEIPDADARDLVSALKAEEYSPVVKVPSGWAFFRAKVTPYPADLTEAASIAKIRSYLTDMERGRMEDWLIAQAETFTARVKEEGFDAAAEAMGLSKQSFGPISLNYGGVDLFDSLQSSGVQEIASAGSNENFWRTAFFTPLESPSTPLVLSGNVTVLYPKEESPAEESSIESVKSIYSGYWLSYNTEMGLRNYFLQSDKLEDRFFEAFYKFIYNPQDQF